MELNIITYRELLKALQGFTSEELDQQATVYIPELDEYQPVVKLKKKDALFGLDPDHQIMEVGW